MALYTDLLPYDLRVLVVDFLFTTVVYHQSTAFYEGDLMTCDTGGSKEEQAGNGIRFFGPPIPFCWPELGGPGPWRRNYPARTPWSVIYLTGEVTVCHRWWNPDRELFTEEQEVMLRVLSSYFRHAIVS